MKNQTNNTSNSKSQTTSSKPREWIKSLFVAVIGGLIVLGGQIFVNPIVARRVRIQESITEKRYEACEEAINILQRELASTTWITGNIPENYIPPEKAPTQLELNVAYSLLATYGTSGKVAEEFLRAFDYEKDKVGQWVKKPIPERNSPKAIGKFVLKLREEMGIKGTGVDPNTFGYIFRKSKE